VDLWRLFLERVSRVLDICYSHSISFSIKRTWYGMVYGIVDNGDYTITDFDSQRNHLNFIIYRFVYETVYKQENTCIQKSVIHIDSFLFRFTDRASYYIETNRKIRKSELNARDKITVHQHSLKSV